MQSHYDVIILGDSLAGRIAATLLARGGCRVLSLEEDLPVSPVWFTSSLHLEKLLENLSGRACLTAPPSFQLLSSASRIDFSNHHPLDEELSREFPEDSKTLNELLTSLRSYGELLETILLGAGRAPLKGLGNGVRFRWKALRGGLGFSFGGTTLAKHLDKLALGRESHAFVEALFTGLSLIDFTSLSYAEAAIIWNSHSREHGASASGLDTLLHQRYEQFHGKTEALANLRQIDTSGQQVRQVVLKNGSSCTADHYLLASAAAAKQLSPAFNHRKLQLASQPSRVVTGEVKGELSPLLSRRVILSDEDVLRLSFGKRGENTLCAIDVPSGHRVPTEDTLRKALSPAFAFTRFELNMPEEKASLASRRTARSWLGQQTTTRLLPNALLCEGVSLLPALGATGETIVGSALASYILSRKPKSKTKS